MINVLVVSGHPNLKESHCNQFILDEYKKNIPNVIIHKLDEYDYKIDVKKEQEALLKADIIIFQFPFYWYGVPGILKLWIDEVFTHGFAYGGSGNKLHGKHLLLGVTIGGQAESYNPNGYNHFNIDELCKPLEQTASLCGMIYHTPIREHGMMYIEGVKNYNTLEEVQTRAKQLSKKVLLKVKALSEKLN